MKNHGVILGQRDSDYIGGTLPYIVENPTGDWTSYLPLGEWQRIDNVDLMACVTFSALNVLETLYYFKTGQRRNFSDRFTAKMSGTTLQGNYLYLVADSVRKDGLVDESDWSAPDDTTWDSYYADIPQAVKDKAKDFLKDWIVQYEFIDVTRESLLYHLKQSPVQVVIPGHAIMNFYTEVDVYHYFDSYEPFVKERTDGFVTALKYVMTKKDMKPDLQEIAILYKTVFGRDPDAGASGYVGQDLAFVLGEFQKSPEWKAKAQVLQVLDSEFNVKL